MLRQSNMLMIGSAGRNAGKTLFACSVIDKFKDRFQIIGVKVTTVQERDGKCPRGGDGCGVCTSLEENYRITEESAGPEGKDTSRLAEAGAEKVYWLRVHEEHLAEGFAALKSLCGHDDLLVCESNSLRNAVEPGLFIILEDNRSDNPKHSCREVLPFADMVINNSSEIPKSVIKDISVFNGTWVLKRNIGAIILAGGKSSRMGTDKSMINLEGETMIRKIIRQVSFLAQKVLISSNDVEKYDSLGLSVIGDELPGEGPLMGICSSLLQSEYDLNFVVACDIPQLNFSLFNRMIRAADGYEAVIPVDRNGRREPLFGLYRKSMIPHIRTELKAGKRKISDAFNRCRVNYLPLEKEDVLHNLNTKKDLALYLTGENDEA